MNATEEQTEVMRHLNNFSVMPGWNATVSQEIAKRLLETDFVFCNGEIRNIKAKHLGCGVYRMTTEQLQYP